MNCCICGKPAGKWGNNPFPLCSKDDFESQCCDSCNGMVIQARIIQSSKKDDTAEINDGIMIFYAKNSDLPTQIIHEQGKFLTGTITSVVKKENNTLYEGTWGNFILDSKTDQFIKL